MASDGKILPKASEVTKAYPELLQSSLKPMLDPSIIEQFINTAGY